MELDFNPLKIRVIVGLGNPGHKNQNTYHNIGRLFVDYLKNQQAQDAKYKILNTDVFMNNSGSFVSREMRKRGAKPEMLLIIHDDSDLALGQFKLSFNRGSAGHGGVNSIIKYLGTKKFWRARIGIRKESAIRERAEKFVLKKMTPNDKKILERVFEQLRDAIASPR